uniref:Major facilitator superfamily (MFS) profile domain-containing protein n=1 Tax=Biomphalaria glabrata TaxID=6526 RepID=A0A2C9LRN3_BIOGL
MGLLFGSKLIPYGAEVMKAIQYNTERSPEQGLPLLSTPRHTSTDCCIVSQTTNKQKNIYSKHNIQQGPLVKLITREEVATKLTDIQYEFDWDSEAQGYLLTSVQFVACLGPLVANMTKSLIGGKFSLMLFSLVIAILSLVSPLAARTNIYLLLAIRIITGICSGTTAPVVGEALAWWSPDSEKLTWIAFSHAGFNVGAVFCSFVSGYLCTVSLDNGWPFIFYFTGTVNLIWLMAWYFLYMDKPEKHPYISETERAYILANRTGMTTSTEKKLKAPYKKILTSIPMIAYVYSSTCYFWTMTVIFTYLPLYISGVLQVTAEKTGILFSAIAFFRFLGAFFWTGLDNWMRYYTSLTKSKNTFEEWRMVWILTSFVYMSAGVVFVFFGRADRQPWAQGKREAVPNIILPFVHMGRRFSNTHETLPLSPISVSKKFDFSLNAQLAFMLPALPESPQLTHQLHLRLNRSSTESAKKFTSEITSSQDIDVEKKTRGFGQRRIPD